MWRGLFLLIAFGFYPTHAAEVDQIHLEAYIKLLPAQGQVVVTEKLVLLTPPGTDSVVLDAVNITLNRLMFRGEDVKFRQTPKQIVVYSSQFKGRDTLEMSFVAQPTKGLFFQGFQADCTCPKQIWTFGQGDGPQHWLVLRHRNEDKLTHRLTIEADAPLTVIANGVLEGDPLSTGTTRLWTYHQQQPHSPYLMALTAGVFRKDLFAAGKRVAEVYARPDLPLSLAAFDALPAMVRILEEATGIPYPWGPLRFVFVADYRATGLENTGCILLDESLLAPSSNPDDLLRVVAHELAHQWFGNYLTAATPEDFWIHEGFATFLDHFITAQLTSPEVATRFRMESLRRIQSDSATCHSGLITTGASSTLYYDAASEVILAAPRHFGLFSSEMRQLFESHPFGMIGSAELLALEDQDWVKRQWPEYARGPLVRTLDWSSNDKRIGVLSIPSTRRRLAVPFEVYTQEGRVRPEEMWVLNQKPLRASAFLKKFDIHSDLWKERTAVAINPGLVGLHFPRYGEAEARWLCLHAPDAMVRFAATPWVGEPGPEFWRARWESEPHPLLRVEALRKWADAETLPKGIIQRPGLTPDEQIVLLTRLPFEELADSLPAWGHHGNYQVRFLSHFRIGLAMGPSLLDSLEADYAPLLKAVLGDTTHMDQVIALARDCARPFLREEALVILLRMGPLPDEVLLPLLISATDFNRIRRNQARNTLQKALGDPNNASRALAIAESRKMTTLIDWINSKKSNQP
jgi:hypothetical protein